MIHASGRSPGFGISSIQCLTGNSASYGRILSDNLNISGGRLETIGRNGRVVQSVSNLKLPLCTHVQVLATYEPLLSIACSLVKPVVVYNILVVTFETEP